MPHTEPAKTAAVRKRKENRFVSPKTTVKRITASVQDHMRVHVHTEQGIPKAEASTLFKQLSLSSPLPLGKIRAELIPDSSWKRAGKRLGPLASQTTARVGHVLALANRVWGNETDAAAWLNNPHPELQGSTPLSLLRTESGGRTVESLLAALEFGFPV